MNAYPLSLPPASIRQLLQRNTNLLILTRKPRLGTQEIHNSRTISRNTRHRKNGRTDIQDDPLAFTVEFTNIVRGTLSELDQRTVMRAGYPTTEDFYQDWLSRRRRFIPDLEIHVCTFQIVEDARYLHARIHRGYTNNPAHAIKGEPQALTNSELQLITSQGQQQRRATLAAAKSRILEELDELAQDATTLEGRRLRNARRAASSL